MSEEALWNNSFYSSSAHISQSSSANHISSLRKSVAVPHSVSSSSIAAGLIDGPTEKEVLNQRTSVMSASPSMKALESILNEKKTTPRRPEAIEEDIAEESENEDTTSDGGQVPSALNKPPFSNPSYTYGNGSGSRVSLPKPPLDASTSTFHTACSTDSLSRSPEEVVPEINTPNHRSDSHNHRYSSSISTIGESGYSVGTPKLDPPAAFYTVKRTTKDYSPQLLTVSGPMDINRGSVSSDQDTTAVEDTPVTTSHHTYPQSAAAASVTTLPQTPAFRETKDLPEPPKSAPNLESTSGANNVQASPKREIKSLIDLSEPSSPKKNSSPALSLQPPFQPTRSSKPSSTPDLISGPVSAPAVPKKSLTTSSGSPSKSPKKAQSGAKNAAPETQKWASSSFGTPRSEWSPRHHSSASFHELDSRPQPSPGGHKRSNTMGDLATFNKPKQTPKPLPKKSATSAELPQTAGAGASKRFSFRGLFKIKSKHHSLTKDLEEMEPSRPSKLKSRSQSSPAFSTLVNPGSAKSENNSKADLDLNDQAKKRQSKSLFGGFKRKKSEGNIAAVSEENEEPTSKPLGQDKPTKPKERKAKPQPLAKPLAVPVVKSQAPHTPTSPGTFAEMDTPATDTLEPSKEGQTIREVDDSDYNFEYTKASDVDESEDQKYDDEINLLNDPPRPHTNKTYGEELTLEPTARLDLPEFKHSETSFGSPLLKIDFSENTPKQAPKPIQSNRSSMNQPKSDQLVGEALFPKSLNALEIESIVSLERSRSMKSIKSGKRSSFINYSGDDENVIVYSGEAGQNSPNTVRRSGSILKNSHSMSSLKGVVQSIDQTVANNLPSPIEYHEMDAQVMPLNNEEIASFMDFNGIDDDNLHDFIEFSDFIDVDNLEFPTSPMQPSQSPPSIVESDEFNSPLDGIPNYPDAIAKDQVDLDVAPPQSTSIESSAKNVAQGSVNGPVAGESVQTEQKANDIPQIVAEEPQFDNYGSQNYYPDMSFSTGEPEISRQTQESDPSLIIVEENKVGSEPQAQAIDSQDAISKSPILEAAYKMAMNEAVGQESTNSVARPISMSFKGFKGPAISKQAMRKNGSHQSLNMYDSSNESSAVGQGFGSSDDESDGDTYSSDEESENDIGTRFTGVTKQSAQAPGLKTTGNLANRGAPSPKLLGFQPPNGPFYHDRIPSLSDQSAASSPRSLTSFISRMRKSPMASPKVQYKTGGVRFSSRIILYDTYNGEEYDRHPDIATCNQLTPLLAQQIREELNEIKSEMEVHQDSHCYTHFF